MACLCNCRIYPFYRDKEILEQEVAYRKGPILGEDIDEHYDLHENLR